MQTFYVTVFCVALMASMMAGLSSRNRLSFAAAVVAVLAGMQLPIVQYWLGV